MDFSKHWKQFLSDKPGLEGGALFTPDGVLLSSATFGAPDDCEISVARCAAAVAIARQLAHDAQRTEFKELVFEGEESYLVLLPILDKAILAVLAAKRTKLGLTLLDMRQAIDERFGPGLATEPIFLPFMPKSGSAHTRPEHD
jgi:predicted regulator of Ras-like GTPase activity (Roadblock/LC7/MglB family)